jgi:hypothetical protein
MSLGGSAGQTMGGSAGEIAGGEAGAAGASACRDSYRACGCGCCSGREPTKRCYYPEVAGHLEGIATEDQRIAQSADCPMMGCSTGVEYVCCSSAAASAGPAEYEAAVIPGGIDRLVVERTGEDGRCSKLSIANRVTAPGDVFEIETSNWSAELGQDAGCTGGGARTAVGGVGYVYWGGQPCVVDFEFTLFFPSESGAFEGVRFSAEDVPVTGGACP